MHITEADVNFLKQINEFIQKFRSSKFIASLKDNTGKIKCGTVKTLKSLVDSWITKVSDNLPGSGAAKSSLTDISNTLSRMIVQGHCNNETDVEDEVNTVETSPSENPALILESMLNESDEYNCYVISFVPDMYYYILNQKIKYISENHVNQSILSKLNYIEKSNNLCIIKFKNQHSLDLALNGLIMNEDFNHITFSQKIIVKMNRYQLNKIRHQLKEGLINFIKESDCVEIDGKRITNPVVAYNIIYKLLEANKNSYIGFGINSVK